MEAEIKVVVRPMGDGVSRGPSFPKRCANFGNERRTPTPGRQPPCSRREKTNFAQQHPTTAALVVEIAVTSAAEDRSLATLYASAGVEEYWIVLPMERRIEVYRRPESGTYLDQSHVEGDATLECGSLPRIHVRLVELFG